jgi:serine/threonine protein kinase
MSIDWIFGEYKILKKIATGGMAEVFLAKRIGMKGFEKLLAIKRIHPQFSENEEFIAMFIDEAKLAAKLNHRNIVQIYDFGSQQDSYYIAMEYIFGKDLRSIMKKSKDRGEHLPLAQCAYIITEAAKGLEYAHTLKDHFGKPLQIIHRDISPQNILLSYEGEVMLADFGIAKAASKSTETRAGVLKGKILYMSPEQAWGKTIDRRSDLYSLGVVLYEMATNRKIFDADSEFSMLEKVRNAEVEFPSDIFESLPKNFLHIIKKALEKNPENRYQSAHEMRVDLENYLLTTQERLNEKIIADYLKRLFKDEIEEERKILTESTEILIEKPPPVEPVIKPPIRERERITVPGRVPEEGKKKGVWASLDTRMKVVMIVILCVLGGLVSYILLTRQPSTKVTQVAERVVRATPPPSPSASTIAVEPPKVGQPKEESVVPEKKSSPLVEKPSPPVEKPSRPLRKPSSPPERPSPPVAKSSPSEERPSPPPGKAREETRAATLVEKPKAVEEERKNVRPVPKPEPITQAEKEPPAPRKEASLKGAEQKAPSALFDLLSHGPELLHENKHLTVLEQVQKLSDEERQNINVRILECFAYLKKMVLNRDKSSKQPWGQLYKSIETSGDRSATPLLIKIAKDQDEYTRLYAVTLLGSIGDQRALNDLQQIANTDPNRKIRNGAARAIALIQKRG